MDNTPQGFEDPLSDIDPIMEQAFSVGAPSESPLNASVSLDSSAAQSRTDTYNEQEAPMGQQSPTEAPKEDDNLFDDTPLSEEPAGSYNELDNLDSISDDLFDTEESSPPAQYAPPEPTAPQQASPAEGFQQAPASYEALPQDYATSYVADGPALAEEAPAPEPQDNFAAAPQETYAAPQPSPVQEPAYTPSPTLSQPEPLNDVDSQISIPIPPPAPSFPPDPVAAATQPNPYAPTPEAPASPAPQQAPVAEESNADLNFVEFPDLQNAGIEGQKLEDGVLSSIPVKVSVELGRSHLSLQEVYELTEGSIIELERLVGEPLDLVINGQVIAQGEVVAIDNKYGLRIKTLISNKTVA